MTIEVQITSRRTGKAQAMKDAWIKETQMFQRIARDGEEADSYETLSEQYDKDLEKHRKEILANKKKKIR